MVLAGAALLAQPPNSSSAATLGAGLKPPPDPGTMGVLAKAPPLPQPRLLDVVLVSSGLAFAGAAGAGAGAGAGVAHSLPPHGSAMPIPPNALADVAAAGGDVAGLF